MGRPRRYHGAMLKYRLLFGPIMVALLLGLLVLDEWVDTLPGPAWMGDAGTLPPGLALLVVFLVVIALASRELWGIIRAKRIEADPVVLALAGVIGCLLIYVMPPGLSSATALAIYATVIVGVFILALVRHALPGRTEGSVAVASVSLFALIYLGTLPGFYLAIRHDHSAWVVAALIVITKSCDVGAYFTGRAIGRHKLVPWLSPGKTWEGLGGGVLLSALLAAVLAWVGNTWFSGPDATVRAYPLWFAAVAGLALGLAGQFGDLTASLFKRDAGVKDSGRSIPGFGGLLDVVDSPLVVAPLAYWLLRLLDVVAGG
ncbi:MAG: phosphatidate cytidylyltransferase [Phycisphaeraceae bacterium]